MRDTYKQYKVNGQTMYAHSQEEAFSKYKESHNLQTGEMVKISKNNRTKWYRVIGETIIEIFKKK